MLRGINLNEKKEHFFVIKIKRDLVSMAAFILTVNKQAFIFTHSFIHLNIGIKTIDLHVSQNIHLKPRKIISSLYTSFECIYNKYICKYK